MNALTQYLQLFDEHKATIEANAPELLNSFRTAARERLEDALLPRKGDEGYDAVSVNDMFAPDFGVNIARVKFPVDMAETFHCGVPNVSSLLAVVSGDTFVPTQTLLRNLPEGVTVSSLSRAAAEMPDVVSRTLEKIADNDNTAVALNTLLLQDGVYIRVARGVRCEKPIQIVNIFSAIAPMMGVRRIVVDIEEGASGVILVCDHSHRDDVQYLSNQVVEINVANGASLDFFDMEESSAQTSRLSQLFARQGANSRLTVNGTTLVSGTTRNSYRIALSGEGAETRLGGMVVASDEQVVDNATLILHPVSHCSSEQMFKYVLDDHATGAFYGTIVVDEAARFTKANQSNRNLLASADARMYTRPRLEIYCDEVKCGHGATIGQLDPTALFYMQSRGIPREEARLMLMQAFMADVLDSITIPALKTRLQHLIDRRISGHKVLCSDCNNTPE